MRNHLSKSKLTQFDVALETSLHSFSDGDETGRLHALLMLSVGRVVSNCAKKHTATTKLDLDRNVFDLDSQVVSHIADWLKAALANNEAWLTNVDNHGRPKKLMKFSTLDQITREANKAMLKAMQKGHAIELAEGDEELICKLNDGFYLVRLSSPEAFDRESAVMQHCVGNGAYDETLQTDGHDIYSVRDVNGRPHITLEIKERKLLQIQGKQNRPPLKKYIDHIVPFLKAHLDEVDIPPARLGYVVDDRGMWHPLGRLPNGLTVKDHLNLCGTEITSLPSNLSIGGSLYLMDSKITSLPDNLRVGGNLNIYSRDMRTLPHGLSIGGDFYLNETDVEEVPSDILVGGYLDLSESSIRRLPDGLKVGDGLNLYKTPIERLPINLYVGGDLSIEKTNVTVLPQGLTVKGDIFTQGLRINHIAADVTVEGVIYHEGAGYSLEEFRLHLSPGQGARKPNLLRSPKPARNSR